MKPTGTQGTGAASVVGSSSHAVTVIRGVLLARNFEHVVERASFGRDWSKGS